jgi:hypothetical protein
VKPPLVRTPPLAGNGLPGSCGGVLTRHLNATWCPSCPQPQTSPGAGAVVQCQPWYRDPLSTSNKTTSLSDAIELFVTP